MSIRKSLATTYYRDIRPGIRSFAAFWLRLIPLSSRQGGVPKRAIMDSARWIRESESRKTWSERGREHWQVKVRDAEMVTGRPPHSLGGDVLPDFFPCRFVQFPPLSVTCIRRGRVALTDGVILSPDDRVFDEFTHHWGEPISRHPIFRTPGLPRLEYRNGIWATLVVPASGQNVGHWLLDGLLRLAILEESGLAADANFILPSAKPWYAEMLQALGYGPERFAGLDGGHWEVEHLLIPSFLGPSGFIRPWACRWLRTRLGIDGRKKGKRRLWVSRSRAKWRKMLNEEEIFSILRKHGFELVQLEDLSFPQQVKLFADAEVVGGPEGAGMSNLIFAPRGIRVLEMHPPRYVNPMFYSVANALEQEYFYLVGRTPREARGPGNAVDMDNYRMDPMDVKMIIRRMGLR
jgi:hypothetical protein